MVQGAGVEVVFQVGELERREAFGSEALGQQVAKLFYNPSDTNYSG